MNAAGRLNPLIHYVDQVRAKTVFLGGKSLWHLNFETQFAGVQRVNASRKSPSDGKPNLKSTYEVVLITPKNHTQKWSSFPQPQVLNLGLDSKYIH